MLKANEAKEISASNTTKERQEITKDLDAAIQAACRLGERQVNLYKSNKLLNIGVEVALANGYRARVVRALDQRDRDYLVVEW